MAIYAMNYDGLRKRDTYNEIIDYFENKQEQMRYPNRMAKFIRNSPQLSNLLDGEGMGIAQLAEQQHKSNERSSKSTCYMRGRITNKWYSIIIEVSI